MFSGTSSNIFAGTTEYFFRHTYVQHQICFRARLNTGITEYVFGHVCGHYKFNGLVYSNAPMSVPTTTPTNAQSSAH